MNNKSLIIVRGIPGAGKSTFANLVADQNSKIISADMYFIDKETGEYIFDILRIKEAHQWCFEVATNAMKEGIRKIFIANTFVSFDEEMKKYFDLADSFEYKIFSIIIENRHGNQNVHDVPTEIIMEMMGKFTIKLI